MSILQTYKSAPLLWDCIIALLPGIVLSAGLILMHRLGNPKSFSGVSLENHAMTPANPRHRYVVSVTFFLLAVASTVSVLVGSWYIIGGSYRYETWWVFGLATLAAGIFAFCHQRFPPLDEAISLDLFKLLERDGSFLLMRNYVRAANGMVAISILLIVVAAVGLAGQDGGGDGLLRDLQVFLGLSSAQLVTGVLFSRAWISWPLAYLIPDSEPAAMYRGVVTWATTHMAVVYVAMMFLFFGALVLRTDLSYVKNYSVAQSLTVSVVVLSPALIQFLTEVVKTVAAYTKGAPRV